MKTTNRGYMFQRKRDENGNPCGNWYVMYSINGKKQMVSLGTADKKKAKKERDTLLAGALTATTTEKVVRHIAEARELLNDTKYELDDVWKQYLRNPSRPQSGTGSLENYERYLKAFFAWLKVNHKYIETVNQITAKEAEDYLEHFWADNNISHTTWNHHLQGLKLVFKYVLKSDVTPFSHFKKKKGIQTKRKDFTPENLEAIFNAFDDEKLVIPDKKEMKLLLYILAFTGLRLSDAVFLRWVNVDFAQKVISCYPCKTRGHAIQVHIPLHSELKAQLDMAESLDKDEKILPVLAAKHVWRKNEKSKKRNDVIVTDFLKILDHVGLKDVATAERGINRRLYGLHSFRHGFCSMMANAGVPVAVLADILGDNISTLQKYYIKVSDLVKVRAVEKIHVKNNNMFTSYVDANMEVGELIPDPESLSNRINEAMKSFSQEEIVSKLPSVLACNIMEIFEDVKKVLFDYEVVTKSRRSNINKKTNEVQNDEAKMLSE